MNYRIENIAECDSPALLIYKDLVDQNIETMLKMVGGNVGRLMPHVKTNKTTEVVKMMVNKGITKFKASTVSEAEMCILAGSEKVLIAHQLVGPKVQRFINLVHKFPLVELSFLVDNSTYAEELNEYALSKNQTLNLYIDVDNGMHRSGVSLAEQELLIKAIQNLKNLKLKGIHLYDGHHRDTNYELRRKKIEADFSKLENHNLPIVVGGTPSFSTHSLNPNVTCSPGTCVFWDWGYKSILPEQEFNFAALVVCRVISKPSENTLTLDLGHKAIAPENSIDKRIKFLNIGDYELLSQSEEHGVLSVKNGNKFKVGDVLYGVPYHVCPTVNLYEEMAVVEDGKITQYWNVIARKRKISC